MGLFDIFKRKHESEPVDESKLNEEKKPTEEPSPELDKNSTSQTETPVEKNDINDQPIIEAKKEPANNQADARDETSFEETNAEKPTKSDDQGDDSQTSYEAGLEKSRSSFGEKLNQLFANFRSVDEDFFDDLEDTLIESDVGVQTATEISDQLKEAVKLNNVKGHQEVQNFVIQKLVEIYDAPTNDENQLKENPNGPTVILFIGVNGAGKTTTIGKMAHQYQQQGKKVLLAAADTFRAGAIQQLAEWAKRDKVDIVKKSEGSDPASVVYDAVEKAKADNYDILFIDTAGRLQNKVNLMKELAKMNKIITNKIPGAPQEVLLVIDATIGQNAMSQAKTFKEVADISGIVLTKLDGTAKGGIVLAIKNEIGIPVKYVGLGESVNDLQEFDPEKFVYGLFKGLVKE
ncbi:signal recognition particle-docking protein FtsY [Fructilactobacillus frigidiflavus]|uniref:signal recognition particle-docking protein FtsY n=1 Tax=Fructilactobacillus frigidiflavus TaxID=3242688 RepID=UPI003757919A